MIGVVTVSDTRTATTDKSGPALVAALQVLGFEHTTSVIVNDDAELIQATLRELCASCEAVFTTGGTGFTDRDVTPEATLGVLDRQAPNLVELLRLKGLEQTPLSHLSRGVAGILGQTLIVNLPGSPKAVTQGVEVLGPLLPHILSQLRGDGCGHEC